MYSVGVIGCGYWGPNLVRNFTQMNRTEVKTVADHDEARLKHMKGIYPGITMSKDAGDIIFDPEIDIVVIATPIRSHFQLASDALTEKKHVFVEKPITASSEEAMALIGLAEKNQVKLMVGHTFLYTAAVRKMKEIIDSGELGEILYISSQRLNLGLFQKDINVIWDLAPHDISIILYLLGEKPLSVIAVGASHINPAVQDVGVLTMEFSEERIAFVQASWLDPDKVRKMTVVGSKKMMVYDDIQPTEKIRIYDRGVEVPKHYDTYDEFHYSYKYGDIYIPKIEGHEPIRLELSHFVDCIEQNQNPLSDGRNGLDVVKILEASQQSLERGNNRVRI
jgi:predicted dehydrogenase